MKKYFLLLLVLFQINFVASQTTCDNAPFVCSGGINPKPSVVGVASLGSPACLTSAPNPNWYIFKTDNSGDLRFNLTQSTNAIPPQPIDIDFACWGPFPIKPNCSNFNLSSCGSCPGDNFTLIPPYVHTTGVYPIGNIIDCSYSSRATEELVIPNAASGVYYILLITNFSGVQGTFQLTQTNLNAGGAGTSDCEPACGVALGETAATIFPNPEINTISTCDPAITSQVLHCNFYSPPANQASLAYKWYLNDVLVPSLTTKSVTVTQSGTWKVEVVHPDCNSASSDAVIINFGTVPVVNTIATLQGALGDCNPTFNLDALKQALVAPLNANDYNVSFYTNPIDADFLTDPITNSSAFPTNSDVIIYVRAINKISNCADESSASFSIDVRCVNSASATGSTICQTGTNTGTLTFSGTPGGRVYFDNDAVLPNYFVDLDATTGNAVWTSPVLLANTTYTLGDFVGGTPVVTVNLGTTATINVVTVPKAGTGTPKAFCSSDAPADLYASITGPKDPGGVWSPALASGTGVYNPAVDSPGNYEYKFDLVGCTSSSTTVVVTESLQPNAGTDGNVTICESRTTAINLYDYLTAAQTGGIWSVDATSTGVGGTFNSAAGTYLPTIGATNYVFRYTIAGSSPCNPDFSLVNVTVTASPKAGTGTPKAFCSSDAPADLYASITGPKDPGGVWSPALASGTGVYNPAVDNPGTYTYSFSLVGCTPSSTTVVVTESLQPNAGTDGNVTICESRTTAINLADYLTGAQNGGVWSIDATSTGVGGTFNSAAGTYLPAIGATNYVFRYTIAGSSPCNPDFSLVNVTVTASPKAGTGTPKAFCSSDAPADLYASITGPKDPGGVWSPALASGTGVYNPAVDSPGNYEYKFDLLGCTPSSTTVVVTESLQPNAGTDGNVTICESRTTAINLYDYLTSAQTGGVWSIDATSTGVGGIFNSAAGTYLPAIGATNYVFRYTIAGSSPCNPDFSLVNVTVTASPKAGTGTPKAFCSSDAPADLYASITGPKDPGGVWSPALASGTGVYNPAVDSPGNYEYKFDLLGCTPSSTTVVVTESLQPNAGTDGNVTICESRTTAINLYDYLTGAQNGGIWSIDATSTGVGGIFNSAAGTYLPAIGATNYVFRYTIAGSSPCNPDFSLVNVTIDKQPNAGISASPLVQCASDFTPVNLFNGIVGEQPLGTWTRLSGSGGFFNAVTGLFTPDVTTSTISTFQYSFAANGSCSGSSSVVTVNISPIPTGVSITGSSVVCAGANTNITLSATPGAILTWNGIPNLVTIPASGSVVLVQNPLSDITYSVTNASLNGCGINVSGVSLFVDTENTPQFLNANILDYSICNGNNLNLKTLLGSTVSGANLEWNAVYGVNVLNPGIAQPGDSSNIDYTVNLVNPNLPGTITITVKPVLGDCKGVSQDIVVTVNTMPVIQQVSVLPATVCNGNATVLTINALPTAANYDWEVSDVNGVVLSNGNTSGTTTSNVLTINLDLVNPLQAGRIKFKITPKNGTCVGQAFKTEFIEVNPIPGKPIFLADKEICSGEKTDLTISAFPNIAQTMFEYTVIDSFNVTGALSSTSLHLAPIHLNDKLENNSDVRGFVKYRVQTVLGTCKGDFTDFIVYVNPAPKPKLIDGYICVDKATGIAFQEYVLDTHLSNPNYIYSWFVLDELSNVYEPIVAANSATFKVVKKGKYKVVVTNRITTCKNEYVAIVEEVFPATDFTFDVTDAFANNAIITVNVNPMGTGVLIYALDGGSFQNSNVFTNVAAGEHEIMVEDEEGCTKISKLITVIDYPKYFTPNGDGYNDFWNIGGLEEKHSATVLIFDRYGKLIKQINPLHKGWDGLYNGKQMPASDYWFTVDYTEKNTKKQFKSHFSLKR